MSIRVLVLYASTHGHTAKIAERIGATLQEQGASAVVREIGQSAGVDPAGFDGVILGASVHAGHHQHEILEWLTRHHEALRARPSAFFSVSLTAADDTDEARTTTRELIDELLEQAGWSPTATTAFAGALQFSKYNLPTRVLIRLIARRHDPHVDVHEDTDYTDWAAVDRFAADFAATVARRAVAS